MQSYKRSTRVGELIQQEISRILFEQMPAEGALVTITGVKLSDDLQDARVFYSILGGEAETLVAQEKLNDLKKEIRHQLAIRLNLRRTPVLLFKFDETPARAARVFELMEKIRVETEASSPAAPAGETPAVPESGTPSRGKEKPAPHARRKKASD